MKEDMTEIKYTFPTPKLTNKKTLEKEKLGTNISILSQTYELPNFLITEILEHDLPDEIILTIKLLHKNGLLNQYLEEIENN